MAKESQPRTPQEYEMLTGGGAESAELSRQGLGRRQLLRRAVGLTAGLVLVEAVGGGLVMIYPNLTGGFGGKISLKKKADYPAALPGAFDIDAGKGVFYESTAKSYISHMSKDTPWDINGQALNDLLASEFIVKDDADGSYWLAIYQRCVHLGCKFSYKLDCQSFKCPCHGSHYNVNGEWLSGPAPRSNDRFALTFSGDTIVVDTSKVIATTQHPSETTRLLQELPVQFNCQ